MSKYSELLKDPRWQRKRLEIMERDDFMCQCCFDSESTLNVYHKYYIYNKPIWDYSDDLLITLCDNCHQIEEDSKYIISDFTKVLLGKGYLSSELIQLLELLRQLPPGDLGMSFINTAVEEYKNIDFPHG